MATNTNDITDTYISSQLLCGIIQRFVSIPQFCQTSLLRIMLSGQQNIINGIFDLINRGYIDEYLQGGTKESLILSILVQDISVYYSLPKDWYVEVAKKSNDEVQLFLNQPTNQNIKDSLQKFLNSLLVVVGSYPDVLPSLSEIIPKGLTKIFTTSTPTSNIKKDASVDRPFDFLGSDKIVENNTPKMLSDTMQKPDSTNCAKQHNRAALYCWIFVLIIIVSFVIYLTVRFKK